MDFHALDIVEREGLKKILVDFTAAGYNIQAKLLNARYYGVPQNPERVIIVSGCNDIDFEYDYPEPTHGDAYSSFQICDFRRSHR